MTVYWYHDGVECDLDDRFGMTGDDACWRHPRELPEDDEQYAGLTIFDAELAEAAWSQEHDLD